MGIAWAVLALLLDVGTAVPVSPLNGELAAQNDGPIRCDNRGNVGENMTFFTFWTTPASTFAPRLRRSIESVFRVHPRANVTVYTDTLTLQNFENFTKLGCMVTIEPLAPESQFHETPLEKWNISDENIKTGRYFYSHLTDGLRLAILYKKGGVYFDTDIIFLRPMTLQNSVGMETALTAFDDAPGRGIALDGHGLNGALLVFSKQHDFVKHSMEMFVKEYSPWFWGCVGPDLLTKVFKTGMDSYNLNVVGADAFYPSDFRLWRFPLTLFNEDLQDLPNEMLQTRLEFLHKNSFAYHFWNHASKDYEAVPNSVFRHILNDFCLFCDEVVK